MVPHWRIELTRTIVALFLILAALCLQRAGAQAVDADSGKGCQSLASADFTGVQDAPAFITSASLVYAQGNVPSYCKVQGYVVPQVGFEVRVPSGNWNSRFIEIGCGGFCGYYNGDQCNQQLRNGFACVVTDMGHKGTMDDTLWAMNNLQAQMDFGFRATHVGAVIGKAIVERFYGKSPQKTYYVGCSTGGYQGVMEAQRYPWDFDGIVAGAPDIHEGLANVRALWTSRTALDADGKPRLSSATLHLVHDAALEKCDMADGLKDGILGNPLGCKFDPGDLVCKGGNTKGCITQTDAEIVHKLYAGAMTSKGEPITSEGFWPGSELYWQEISSPWSEEQFFKYAWAGYTTGSGWKYTDFNFDDDYKRLGVAPQYDNSNPDLRNFKRAGGKILIYEGGDDTIDLPGAVTDYYEAVEREMGGRSATQSFARLFVIPGMEHCVGGPGATTIDYFAYLQDWVEKGQAPEKLIGSHVSDEYLISHHPGLDFSKDRDVKLWQASWGLPEPLDPAIPVSFKRPVYPYPTLTRYLGHGDPNDASSFGPVEPKSDEPK
ncbi:tannase/feruloyl esterase family alpha/beta hydrolase [Acidobacteria bacterium AB60]|nr:tannase/feruloyl esterase family alpha/beta hydrolase [Acidobacteria bacterium AB60]